MAEQQGITKISVQGFKSLYDKAEVEIRALTVLAGANSSGKSSIMQPLLLMKQTLESEYEPKVFLLDGANVRFTDPKQFFSLGEYGQPISELSVSIEAASEGTLSTKYALLGQKLFIKGTSYNSNHPASKFRTKAGQDVTAFTLRDDMSQEELNQQIPVELENLRNVIQNISVGGEIFWSIETFRCFLNIGMAFADGRPAMEGDPLPYAFFPINNFSHLIQEIIHVQGLRDNPRRDYPVASLEGKFKGTFDNYFASVIAQSSNEDDGTLFHSLSDNLLTLGLGSGISTKQRNGKIEIEVPLAYTGNTINIADVGLAVSQVLPVLVALLVAKAGQLVYIEQPELHLHPRAQVKLAQILADAAKRGVRVVVETHSSLLLLGIQTLIAEGKLENEKVILHWFKRDEEGKTSINSVVPDENGAYGDWDEDFGDVELEIQGKYLDAVTQRQAAIGD